MRAEFCVFRRVIIVETVVGGLVRSGEVRELNWLVKHCVLLRSSEWLMKVGHIDMHPKLSKKRKEESVLLD